VEVQGLIGVVWLRERWGNWMGYPRAVGGANQAKLRLWRKGKYQSLRNTARMPAALFSIEKRVATLAEISAGLT